MRALAQAVDLPVSADLEDGFAHDPEGVAETIRRVAEAATKVLYAPVIHRREDIATLVRAVDRPVNVLGGTPKLELDQTELSKLGVRRLSLGGSLAWQA